MAFRIFSVLFLLIGLSAALAHAQPFQPVQSIDGPGGTDYGHLGVEMRDFAQAQDGYWLFEPSLPKADSARVVVFLHGYGGYNPMVYGRWIRHLVRRGEIVIFPRYQRSMLAPGTKKFTGNAAKAIRDAIALLKEEGRTVPITDQLAIVGHSYGGVIGANLAVQYAEWGIPKPGALFLCAPGTSLLRGGRLDDYSSLPEDLRLLIMVHKKDRVVGECMGKKIFREAAGLKFRNLLRQYPDKYGEPRLKAGHNETYSLDERLDSGHYNLTMKRALRRSQYNAIDYNGYWRLFDALLDCVFRGTHCSQCFGDTPAQKSLGRWSDGKPINPLEVIEPD